MEINAVICSSDVQSADLAELAKAAGLRIVARTGGTPVYYEFVPDFGRAGELQWVKTAHEEAAAMAANPAEEPVVLRKKDITQLMAFVGYALMQAESTAEDRDAYEAIQKILCEKAVE